MFRYKAESAEFIIVLMVNIKGNNIEPCWKEWNACNVKKFYIKRHYQLYNLPKSANYSFNAYFIGGMLHYTNTLMASATSCRILGRMRTPVRELTDIKRENQHVSIIGLVCTIYHHHHHHTWGNMRIFHLTMLINRWDTLLFNHRHFNTVCFNI